jgi:hypothetical protein
MQKTCNAPLGRRVPVIPKEKIPLLSPWWKDVCVVARLDAVSAVKVGSAQKR